MKINLLLSLALPNVVTAVKFVSGPEAWPAAMGFNLSEPDWDLHGPQTVSRIAAVAPKRQEMKARFPNIPNSKTVKIRYGPYSVPAPRVAGGEGMVWNSPSPSVDKPCAKCMIIGMNAGLEYAEGQDANTDTKMWLHHMVLFNIGTKAWDATCTVFGLPHMIVGSLPSSSERIFSSGNERTLTLFNTGGENSKANKIGYPVLQADRFGLIADLMNMNPQAKSVYLTMYYDYVEGNTADWDEVKPIWFDVNQCGTSEVSGRQDGANFRIQSTPWTANFDGEIIGAGGHIHDGGSHLEILANNELMCTSTAYYGPNELAKSRADIVKAGNIPSPNITLVQSTAGKGDGHSHEGGQHIVAMSVCGEQGGKNGSPASPLKNKKVAKGQSWIIRAYYDYKKFTGMRNNQGGMDSVMGISIMFVKTNQKIRTA